jgi:hypothetical protein
VRKSHRWRVRASANMNLYFNFKPYRYTYTGSTKVHLHLLPHRHCSAALPHPVHRADATLSPLWNMKWSGRDARRSSRPLATFQSCTTCGWLALKGAFFTSLWNEDRLYVQEVPQLQHSGRDFPCCVVSQARHHSVHW